MLLCVCMLFLHAHLVFTNLPEALCPAIPLGPGMIRDTEDLKFGAIVTYSCAAGYEMEDGTRKRTLICMSNEEWHTKAPECTRKLYSERSALRCSQGTK